MKIIFGGAFNPPTIAHKEIYKYVMERIKADSFIYLPVSTLYTKNGLESNEHRYNMLKLLVKGTNALVSRDEIDDLNYKGTHAYLKSLNEESMFLMGSDNLRTLDTWINYPTLIKECKFIVISRGNLDDESYIKNDEVLSKYKDNFILLKGFDMDISSSKFRKTKDKNLLTKEVYEYIKENKLYEVL